MYRNGIKRSIDFLFALVGLVLLSPIFIMVVVALTVANRGQVFFLQPRPGKNAQVFKVLKFKTMNDARDDNGNLLSDELRLTTIGKLVRQTSLDEIPQLLNVVRGDMSLVGPRPLLTEYLDLYTPEQKRRHEVRPGITGWAQVNGRNAINWRQKFEYDIWYVDHVSFWVDLKIIFMTILKVFKAEGISGSGVATAEKFNGRN